MKSKKMQLSILIHLKWNFIHRIKVLKEELYFDTDKRMT